MDKNINESLTAVQDDCFEAAKTLLNDPASILANIMASMGDGISIQDLNMRIVYQNKFMIDHFGSHVGDFCYNIYEKRSTACEGCPIIESYRTGQVTKALRVGITNEGIPFRFENIASVLRNDEGKIVAGIELCRIVEDREKAFDDLKKAMETLKQMHDKLIRAEKLAGIGQLAEGVAHEINNPTMYIMSNLCAMQEYVTDFFKYIDSLEEVAAIASPNDSQTQGVLETVRQIVHSEDYRFLKSDLPQTIEEAMDGLKRIKTIVSRMLAFASISDSGCYMVDINEEIEATLALLDSEITKKGLLVKSLGATPKTFADPQQLKQMFFNLILNAYQAIESAGTITIKTDVENNHIRIEISDDGAGIPQDVVPNIFNPFFTTREVGSGIGLGLSLVYSIVESHNGSIDVQSELGQGTTFTIRIPVAAKEDT